MNIKESDDRKIAEKWIRDFIASYPESHDVETRWKEPIIGIADAEDPLYADLKKIISPTHGMPEDFVPGAKSVIVVFVPFEEWIVESNLSGEESSREWDYAYIETNNMLTALTKYLYDKITEAGYKASDLPISYNYDRKKLISDWSHRSSAYIAGIGKFGINNMLITESGCCGRVVSVITDWKLEPDVRPEEEYCLYKRDGTCGVCIKRCPNNAFSINGSEVIFDRFACDEQIEKLIPAHPIGQADACGKCLVGVPCSFRNPAADK